MIYKVMSGRKIEEDEVRQLVAEGEIGPLDGFVSAKTGNRFPSKVKIVDDEKNPGSKKAELDFGNKVDVNELVPFWTDPKTGAELCEAPTSYVLRQRGRRWLEGDLQGRQAHVPEASHPHARDPARGAAERRI
jgi:DNA topoisomerase-3